MKLFGILFLALLAWLLGGALAWAVYQVYQTLHLLGLL